jgi:hypothetical protein
VSRTTTVRDPIAALAATSITAVMLVSLFTVTVSTVTPGPKSTVTVPFSQSV